jgi:hypothetical protein
MLCGFPAAVPVAIARDPAARRRIVTEPANLPATVNPYASSTSRSDAAQLQAAVAADAALEAANETALEAANDAAFMDPHEPEESHDHRRETCWLQTQSGDAGGMDSGELAGGGGPLRYDHGSSEEEEDAGPAAPPPAYDPAAAAAAATETLRVGSRQRKLLHGVQSLRDIKGKDATTSYHLLNGINGRGKGMYHLPNGPLKHPAVRMGGSVNNSELKGCLPSINATLQHMAGPDGDAHRFGTDRGNIATEALNTLKGLYKEHALLKLRGGPTGGADELPVNPNHWPDSDKTIRELEYSYLFPQDGAESRKEGLLDLAACRSRRW